MLCNVRKEVLPKNGPINHDPVLVLWRSSPFYCRYLPYVLYTLDMCRCSFYFILCLTLMYYQSVGEVALLHPCWHHIIDRRRTWWDCEEMSYVFFMVFRYIILRYCFVFLQFTNWPFFLLSFCVSCSIIYQPGNICHPFWITTSTSNLLGQLSEVHRITWSLWSLEKPSGKPKIILQQLITKYNPLLEKSKRME